MNNGLSFRNAEKNDISLILHFIKELASYEKMLDDVIATEDILNHWIFEEKKAEVFFVLENNKEIGFALFFHNFSTFVGRAGLYVEDVYIMPEYRKKGYGKAVFKKLAQIAVERGCGRMEWSWRNWKKERKSLTKENASLTARRENLIRWTRKLSELKKIFIRI